MNLTIMHRIALLGALLVLVIALLVAVQGIEGAQEMEIEMQQTYTKAFCEEKNGLMQCEDRLVVIEDGVERVESNSFVTGFAFLPVENQ